MKTIIVFLLLIIYGCSKEKITPANVPEGSGFKNRVLGVVEQQRILDSIHSVKVKTFPN